ncbi:MAG: nucleoside triphosphate pyrophosphohydrolase [Mucinivorans sp.]
MQEKLEAIGKLLEIMDELRQKCPWDREQTMLSLRTTTIEECFELTEAVVEGDAQKIKKELGDVLLHIVFYSKIAEEQGLFTIEDVAEALSEKLIYRHPHVFATTEVESAQQVSQNWEELKRKEKDGNKSVLAGVPKGMPALSKACRIQQKAAHVGFDWTQREDVWAKVHEELQEVEDEVTKESQDGMEAEFGDLMFSIINAARLYNIDPDLALERTNQKFIKRFNYLEQQTIKKGLSLHDMTLQQMNVYWNAAKKL